MSKRLVEKARKGIFYFIESDAHVTSCSLYCCTAMVADKGHFIVFTEDGVRFMVPLAFLRNSVFQELLRVSEDELGLLGHRLITLPCNASFMEHVLSRLKRRVTKYVEIQALLASLGANRCSASVLCNAGFNQQQIVVS